ncbi:MAG: non-repetitive nucleoporin [Lasallia pustulata]|uniref:Non-repetitive nucleoporin n=1 Tax=Lasallia pustulata TaxID=136370 RepID=A0A5M8PYE1_9LECA|nr:MAG: non-repetitive nucleoporin [Lasallia pustulata]
MSFSVQTPQRPLPGAYLQTPAVSRTQPNPTPQPGFSSRTSNSVGRNVPQPSNQSLAQQSQPQQQPGQHGRPGGEPLDPMERASKTINEALAQEKRYPELDSYIGQGISSDYNVSGMAAWAPFQKIKLYDIPDRIFDQYNRAQVSTLMGLFAELNHAWVAIDNALYIWDYTRPGSDLIGFEEQPNSITAVRMVVPRPGVFVPSISRLLVVATTAEIILVGLAPRNTPTSGMTIILYETRMSVPTRGMDICVIECSAATGRIFFTGKGDGDIYELTYQQEEKWFQGRCGKINHTTKGLSALAPALPFGQKQQSDYITQMVVDDSRKLLYTLSSKSTIRTFHMKPNGGLDLVIIKHLTETLSNIGHMTSQSELISPKMTIVSISSIPAQEASKLHLVATTSTGCRVFMSATSSYGWSVTESSSAPTSMQVQHVKFPPADPVTAQASQQQNNMQVTPYGGNIGINTSSKALLPTRRASRYPPGYFFCFVSRAPQAAVDSLFITAPDTGRIARPQEPSQLSRFAELGIWLEIGGHVQDIGLVSAPFSAVPSPAGFGNELAVQYDKTSSEVAILTNTGVHTLRRRRLVDMFASCIRVVGSEEGLEEQVKKFIRQYGRGETAATAVAVACGQGLDVTSDSRIAEIINPEVVEHARRAFIDFGGKPTYNENLMIDQSLSAIDMVRPSPRHDGLALYIARLVRSIWKAPIAVESVTPSGGLAVNPSVSLANLQGVQRALTKLQEFLNNNKTFIDGLAGPEALGRVATKNEEVALQAEHRALHALVLLISNIVEGISFVLVLFDERITEIVLSLPNETRQQARNITYEGLFCTSSGKDLAKELVKAIVNRNIANGSNVDTVAEALRRRCGSFCSADDVVIFKAQEQLKKASEAGSGSEFGRNLLNESLRLFKQVASSLSMEQLQWAVQQYVSAQFYAGAIELALKVAQEGDRGNRALSWIQEGRPEQDPRATVFEARKRCYDLAHQVITALDQISNQPPDMVSGQYATRRDEAYNVINTSEDEVFQTNLYDWYLAQNQSDRLLQVQSPYVAIYLERKSSDDVRHANLLWEYYANANRYHDAAVVQLALAKSAFALPLDKRIEYLSRAKANASAYAPGVGRQPRQLLLHEVSDLLEVASIQDDLLQRLKADPRGTRERKLEIANELDGPTLSLTELYNRYADQASYFDVCILIYQAADHRNRADIAQTWQNLLDVTHRETVARGEAQPYEAVIERVRSLGTRLNLSESTFPIPVLVPLLERYSFENQRGVGPATWVMDLFLELQVPYESIFPVLEGMLYDDEAPFGGRNRRYIAVDMLHLVRRWFHDTGRGKGKVFGSEANAAAVSETLLLLQQVGLEREMLEECQALRARVELLLR